MAIVHLVKYGLVACMREMPPAKWPEGHAWASDWWHVTCPECLKGKDEPYTFHIDLNGPSIYCAICGSVSYNVKDVEQHYCARCHCFHDDLWPPARAALIGHPELINHQLNYKDERRKNQQVGSDQHHHEEPK